LLASAAGKAEGRYQLYDFSAFFRLFRLGTGAPQPMREE